MEGDGLLNKGVGADGEVDFAAGDAGAGFAFEGLVERAGEEGHAVGLAGGGGGFVGEKFAGAEVVLRGEDFGGGHQRRLEAVFDGDQRGLHGDDSFAGADIALEEAAHGLGAGHVGDDFGEHAFLRGGGVEGEDLLEGGADFGRGGEAGAGALAHATAFELEAQLQVPELFEDEAAVGWGLGGGEGFERGAGQGESGGRAGPACAGGGRSRVAERWRGGFLPLRAVRSWLKAPPSASSSNMDQRTRRVHLEVSLAPQGVLAPSDS